MYRVTHGINQVVTIDNTWEIVALRSIKNERFLGCNRMGVTNILIDSRFNGFPCYSYETRSRLRSRSLYVPTVGTTFVGHAVSMVTVVYSLCASRSNVAQYAWQMVSLG